MSKTDVIDTIISMLKYRVSILNLNEKFVELVSENIEQFKIEIDVLLLLLNLVCSYEHWTVNYLVDRIELGYYDDNGNWVSVEK